MEKEIFNESIKISAVREVITREVQYYKNFVVNKKFQKILDSVRYIIQSKNVLEKSPENKSQT